MSPTRTDGRTHSLQWRLLALMATGFLALLLLISLLLWNYSRAAANRTYDLLLAGAALAILERAAPGSEGPTVDIPYSAMDILGLAPRERVAYRVFSSGWGAITGAADLPLPEDLSTSTEPRFFEATYSGEPFRFVVQARPVTLQTGRDWVSVQVGHTLEARRAQQLALFLYGIAGLGVVSLIGLGFVWLAIRRALSPLRQIEADLSAREPTDLSLLDARPPREIRSLFEAINGFIERLRASRNLTETFIADVAHQTRTALSALQGQLALAADARDLTQIRTRMAKADSQARRTIRLTNQLLAHAMVIHRSEKAGLKPVALTPVVRDHLAEMLRDSQMRGVALTLDAELGEGEDVIQADELSVREALRNLIENAVRHGPVDNEIHIDLRRDGPGRIALSVSDAGPGIPEHLYEEATARFSSLSRNTAGSGLGLAIVRAVADSHAAELRLERSKAGGLRAVLSFPVLAASRAPTFAVTAIAVLGLAIAATPGDAVGQGRSLTVFSATDTSAMTPLIERFEALNPGLSVDYREYQTVGLHQALLDPATSEPADVVISSAMDLQVDLVNRGLGQRLEVPAAQDLPKWAMWRSELFGFTFEPAAIVYNRRALAPESLPATHQELASFVRKHEDRLAGRIGTYDLRGSGIGYLYATQDVVQGLQAQRLAEVLGRSAARTFCCTLDMVEATARGDLEIAINVIGSYALAAAENDPRIGIHFLDDYNLVMARTAFVPRTARNAATGARFVAFLLSDEGQRLIAEDSQLLPIRPVPGVETPALALLRKFEGSFLPIRLGPGLLTYLDGVKRERFLDGWYSSIDPSR